MSVTKYFTDEDPQIIGSAQSDPIGLEIIWAGYAQKIFQNRVNSIVNDIRSYTIVLFHLWVTRKVKQNIRIEMWKDKARVQKYHAGAVPDFDRAVQVFLEKIMLMAFSRYRADRKFDEDGLIGLSNARNLNKMLGGDFPYILDHREGEILVRQTQLGASGRYRTPFIQNLKLIDSNTGLVSLDPESWDRFEQVFKRYPRFSQLADKLCSAVEKAMNKPNSTIHYASLEEETEELYVQCFGSRQTIAKQFYKFWFEELNLHNSESKWLWNALPKEMDTYQSAEDLYKRSIALAEKSRVDPKSYREITCVCEVEPFLAIVYKIFQGVLFIQNHTLDHVCSWVKKHFGAHPLKFAGGALDRLTIDVISGEGYVRLLQLYELRNLPAEELVEQIIEYHVRVSKYRQAEPWVSVVDGVLKRSITEKKNRMEENPDWKTMWIHPYYSPQFQSIAKTLIEGMRL